MFEKTRPNVYRCGKVSIDVTYHKIQGRRQTGQQTFEDKRYYIFMIRELRYLYVRCLRDPIDQQSERSVRSDKTS